MMKKTVNPPCLFLIDIHASGHDSEREASLFQLRNKPLLIARQGSFAVGGNILQRPGTYDNSRFPGWGQAVEAGRVTMPTTPPWTSEYRPMPAYFL